MRCESNRSIHFGIPSKCKVYDIVHPLYDNKIYDNIDFVLRTDSRFGVGLIFYGVFIGERGVVFLVDVERR